MFEYEEPRRRRYTVYGKENKAGNGYFKIMYALCPPLLIRINLKQETQTARFFPKVFFFSQTKTYGPQVGKGNIRIFESFFPPI